MREALHVNSVAQQIVEGKHIRESLDTETSGRSKDTVDGHRENALTGRVPSNFSATAWNGGPPVS